MSRGLGHLERLFFTTIRDHAEPVTFAKLTALLAEACGHRTAQVFRNSQLRSWRRALARLVRKGYLITLGNGDRRDPYKYWLNPDMNIPAKDPAAVQALIQREQLRHLRRLAEFTQ
jgi:hypothetical protein